MTEVDHEISVPEGWKKTTLGAVRKDYSGSIDPSQRADQFFEHYSVPSFDSGHPTIEQGANIGSTKKKLEEGMVLLCKINPRINRVWKVESYTEHPKIGSTEWIRFPRIDGLDPDYLRLYMSQDQFRNYLALESSGAGSSLMRVKKSVVGQYPFIFPPLPEQRRIVSKVEKLFSNLDSGLENLETAERQLERYRLSVLQAAVEGRLTAEWRRTHNPEPADQLLERILEERREQWEERYRWERYESKGKEPPSGWRSRYSSPEKPSLREGLPEIPDDWTWITLDQVLSEDLRNGRSVRSREGGFPVLRLTAINDGSLDLSETKEGDWTREEASRFIVEKNDFYVTRGNGSLSLVGRGGLAQKVTREVAFPDTMIRVRVNQEFYLPQFVRLVWDSRLVRDHLESAARTSAGIYKINQTDLRTTILPLPPLREQKRLVDEIERHVSVAQEIERQTASEQARSERLEKSILKVAFSGDLHTSRGRTGKRDPKG